MSLSNESTFQSKLGFIALVLSIVCLGAVATIPQWLPDLLFKNVVSVTDNVLDPQEKILFDGIQKRLDALSETVAHLESNMRNSQSEVDLSALADEMNTILINQAEITEHLNQLSEMSGMPTHDAQKPSQVLQTYEAIQKQLDDLEEKMSVYVEGESQLSAYILTITQLRDASRGEAPFLKEFNSVYQILEDDSDRLIMEAIRPYAVSGLPSFDKLREDYYAKVAELTDIDLIASDQTWLQKVNQAIKSLIRIRPSEDNQSVEANRALLLSSESLMKGNYDEAALQKLNGLSAEMKEALGPWFGQYKARILLQDLLLKFNQGAIDRLSLLHQQAGKEAPVQNTEPAQEGNTPKVEPKKETPPEINMRKAPTQSPIRLEQKGAE